jgi:hypothetical protein
MAANKPDPSDPSSYPNAFPVPYRNGVPGPFQQNNPANNPGPISPMPSLWQRLKGLLGDGSPDQGMQMA